MIPKNLFRLCLGAVGLCILTSAIVCVDHMRTIIEERATAARLAVLVKRSTIGETLYHHTLNDSPRLTKADVAAAVSYVRGHPDSTSYHVLIVLRNDFPSSYATVPSPTKAAILCSA